MRASPPNVEYPFEQEIRTRRLLLSSGMLSRFFEIPMAKANQT